MTAELVDEAIRGGDATGDWPPTDPTDPADPAASESASKTFQLFKG